MNLRPYISLLLVCLAAYQSAMAALPAGVQPRKTEGFRIASDCAPPTGSAQLDINNVRTIVYNGGDMWWDLVGNPFYEIPRGSGKHALFAGSLWIGGLDESGQLRVAAQTYRQDGYDFWAGPLTDGKAEIDAETCKLYDKMYKINKTEIDDFRADWADGKLDNPEKYPNVFAWPAVDKGPNGGKNSDGAVVSATRTDGSKLYLAPFVDMDGNVLEYNPGGGDYPKIDGDQAIWWVINDKGNIHTATGGAPVGIEIHMMAFAFTTANAVNDMTFYRQTVINRSSLTVSDTYIGQWTDADLGNAFDDYVGCDTTLGLGYVYNGDADDNGAQGYGLNPPACGIDFFQGPLADQGDGVDNDKDGITDEAGETISMAKFVYYNNDFSLNGNPEVAAHYYGYLRGIWKDGSSMVANNKNGYKPTVDGPETNYMFPGNPVTGQGWTEANAKNPVGDRRMLQSAGRFTLRPGVINEVVTGAVWAREYANDQFGSIQKLFAADKVAQALFDNNFQLLGGPDAPRLSVTELDRELLLRWDYAPTSNNYNESYQQADPVLKANNVKDSVFRFQGYMVYQLADGTVRANELTDPDRARLIAQCDIKDNVTTIVNRAESAASGVTEPVIVDEVMVQGQNKGITRSFRVASDAFATTSDPRLKNYTTYYFSVIAYAYNDTSSDGRKFVQGNSGYAITATIPHKTAFESEGSQLNAKYGTNIQLTQIAGVGNGGKFVKISPETEATILTTGSTATLKYQEGAAPIIVKVTDPKSLTGKSYRVDVLKDLLLKTVIDTVGLDEIYTRTYAEWSVYEGTTETGPWSQSPIFYATYSQREIKTAGGVSTIEPARPKPLVGTERLVTDVSGRGLGFSVSVQDVNQTGPRPTADPKVFEIDENSGVIGGTLAFSNPLRQWLSGVGDRSNDVSGGIYNWIINNNNAKTQGSEPLRVNRSALWLDSLNSFSKILNGTIAPYGFTRSVPIGENANGLINPSLNIALDPASRCIRWDSLLPLRSLPNVDIVFTSDQSKWSECVVVETSPDYKLGSGAWVFSAKWRDNTNKDGSSAGAKTATVKGHGRSWFPGYAVDVVTGQRLNIFFGESTWDKQNRGDDMRFNPTSSFGGDRIGGRHYLYVTNLPYDGCTHPDFNNLYNANDVPLVAGLTFTDAVQFPAGNNLAELYKHVGWVSVPIATDDFSALIANPANIPTDARMSVRVNVPFQSHKGTTDAAQFTFSTGTYAPKTALIDTAKSALDLIRVLPNPYYGFSHFETGQLDNAVKITNLPNKCTINIFNIAGQLVRQYTKASDVPFQDWDLRNAQGVPVASGVYMVHIDAPGLGEKTVKMLAVMRRIDLDSF